MPNIINADNGLVSGSVGLKYSCDNTGVLALQTSGNTAMTIDGSGNVGIGTTTPGRILDIQSALPSAQILATTGTNRTWLRAVNTSGNFYFGIDSSTGGVFGTAYARVLYGDGAYPMTFYTNATERMRIDSSGNVGIGTTSITAIGTGVPTLELKGTSGSFTGRSGGISLISQDGTTNKSYIYADTDLYIQSTTATNTRFYTNNAERMRITSAGEVLVGGTTAISSVSGAVNIERAGTPILSFFRNDTTVLSTNILGAIQFWGNDTTSNTPANLAYIYAIASGDHAAGDNPTDLAFGTTADGSATVTERMRLTSSGTLLIGTTVITNDYKIKVTDGATNTGLLLSNTSGGNSVANDGTLTSSVGNGSIFMVSENITGDGALFFATYKSATVTLVSDPNGRYANSVTSGRICVTKSANTGTITITNKLGTTASITVARITNSD